MMRNTIVVASFTLLVFTACSRATSPSARTPSAAAPATNANAALRVGYMAGDGWEKDFEPKSLTADEMSAVVEAAAKLPDFPGNAFNGCQARAEVVYRAVSDASHGKAYKIWLLTGDLVSTLVSGTIIYRPPGGADSRWEYHVAVAFKSPDGGTQVIDALTSKKPQDLSAWLQTFTPEGLVVQTWTKGESYSFNKFSLSLFTPRTGVYRERPLLSEYYGYTGVSAEAHEAAKAIATDALTIGFRSGQWSKCTQLKKLADGNNATELSNAASAYLPVPAFRELSQFEHDNHCGGASTSGASQSCPPYVVPARPIPDAACDEPIRVFRLEVEKWMARGL